MSLAVSLVRCRCVPYEELHRTTYERQMVNKQIDHILYDTTLNKILGESVYGWLFCSGIRLPCQWCVMRGRLFFGFVWGEKPFMLIRVAKFKIESVGFYIQGSRKFSCTISNIKTRFVVMRFHVFLWSYTYSLCCGRFNGKKHMFFSVAGSPDYYSEYITV